MPCIPTDFGDGSHGFICVRGRRGPRRKCPCGVVGSLLCDGRKPGRKRTCDAALCPRCTTRRAPDVDLCPACVAREAEEAARAAAAPAQLELSARPAPAPPAPPAPPPAAETPKAFDPRARLYQIIAEGKAKTVAWNDDYIERNNLRAIVDAPMPAPAPAEVDAA